MLRSAMQCDGRVVAAVVKCPDAVWPSIAESALQSYKDLVCSIWLQLK
jgi:hypothetical protein